MNDEKQHAWANEVAAELGLSEPLSSEVLRGASADPDFARNIAEARNDSAALQQLLRSPPEAPAATEEITDAELLVHGARSIWEWIRGGLQTVDLQQWQQRVDECRHCPHLRAPPDNWLYRLTLTAAEDMSICGLCGCVISRKAWLRPSRCPSESPNQPGFDRWGEPFIANR